MLSPSPSDDRRSQGQSVRPSLHTNSANADSPILPSSEQGKTAHGSASVPFRRTGFRSVLAVARIPKRQYLGAFLARRDHPLGESFPQSVGHIAVLRATDEIHVLGGVGP